MILSSKEVIAQVHGLLADNQASASPEVSEAMDVAFTLGILAGRLLAAEGAEAQKQKEESRDGAEAIERAIRRIRTLP